MLINISKTVNYTLLTERPISLLRWTKLLNFTFSLSTLLSINLLANKILLWTSGEHPTHFCSSGSNDLSSLAHTLSLTSPSVSLSATVWTTAADVRAYTNAASLVSETRHRFTKSNGCRNSHYAICNLRYMSQLTTTPLLEVYSDIYSNST